MKWRCPNEPCQGRVGRRADRGAQDGGCLGCLLVVLVCLALDAATIFAGYQIVMLVRGIIVG